MTARTDDLTFDEGIERALIAAERAHRGQRRKDAHGAPYVLHPIHCALTLARLGCDATLIRAAILHDVVEDCDGWDGARVEREFGPRVTAIVLELTEDKSKSWAERKQWQVDHVPHMSDAACVVKAADKIHNLRTLASQLATSADRAAVWSNFHGGRERTLATSRALVDVLAARLRASALPCGPELARGLTDAIVALEATESSDG